MRTRIFPSVYGPNRPFAVYSGQTFVFANCRFRYCAQRLGRESMIICHVPRESHLSDGAMSTGGAQAGLETFDDLTSSTKEPSMTTLSRCPVARRPFPCSSQSREF